MNNDALLNSKHVYEYCNRTYYLMGADNFRNCDITFLNNFFKAPSKKCKFFYSFAFIKYVIFESVKKR
jgi:hypothetical protein